MKAENMAIAKDGNRAVLDRDDADSSVLQNASVAEEERDELESVIEEVKSLKEASVEVDEELGALKQEVGSMEAQLEEIVNTLAVPIESICEMSVSYKKPRLRWDLERQVLMARYTRDAAGDGKPGKDYVTTANMLSQWATLQVDKMTTAKAACEKSCAYTIQSFFQPFNGDLWCVANYRQKPAASEAGDTIVLKLLVTELTKKASEQALQIAQVIRACEQSVSIKDACQFYQRLGKPLRCTWTHVVEGRNPSKRWILNAAAVVKRASKQISEVHATIKAGQIAFHEASMTHYMPPRSLDDFFESETGEIFYKLKIADDYPYISEKSVTMPIVAKTLITWAEKNSNSKLKLTIV